MDNNEAEIFIKKHTHEGSGIFTQLRLGINPGHEAINSFRHALKAVGDKYKSSEHIPRHVALSCGIVMHFASEAVSNLNMKGVSQEIVQEISDIEQWAFNALAGDMI